MNIYMDNAASSFPKAPGTAERMLEYLNNNGSNINRSSHRKAVDASIAVFETRSLVKKLFNFIGDESHIIFTPGATYSLNFAISGYINKDSHVLISPFEHNAVMRPLRKIGAKISTINLDNLDLIDKEIDLCIISHVSNVSGEIFPIDKISKILKKKNIPLIIDASASAGHIDIDFESLNISCLCAPCHKGLLSSHGLGIMILDSSFAKKLNPIIRGGTGSLSESDIQPEFLPDKFESGTPNIPGILALNEAVKYILDKGIIKIRETEKDLTNYFLDRLIKIKNYKKYFRIIGNTIIDKRVGIISLDFKKIDNSEVSFLLESNYNIMTRSGMHCSPNSHKNLKTYPKGTVRFSISHFTTKKEIDITTKAIEELINEY